MKWNGIHNRKGRLKVKLGKNSDDDQVSVQQGTQEV